MLASLLPAAACEDMALHINQAIGHASDDMQVVEEVSERIKVNEVSETVFHNFPLS